MVQKYFEIPAAKSVILGNMPKQCEKIFTKNDYINITNDMSNQEIEKIILNSIKNKKNLIDITERMFVKIHEEHNFKLYVKNLIKLIKNIES